MWLRSKGLGGKGWDIGYVRQQLGHEDLKSIEHYIALVNNEERALREHAATSEAEKSASKVELEKQQQRPFGEKVIMIPAGGVVVTGVAS
ncbi:MAG: hypothetical protein DMG83_27245 [Acidobacteria bacterium]|nr:MAG: hypothetical protein DMG83_27245 [Acidobacteriota bacterium]